MWKRVLVILPATWLLFSSYALPHSRAYAVDAWVVGLLTIGFAALSIAYNWARYATAALGVWLILFIAIADGAGTRTVRWHDLLVGLFIALLSLVPERQAYMAPGSTHQLTDPRNARRPGA
jgi:hypothetical protein